MHILFTHLYMQVNVRNLSNGTRIDIKSAFGYEIGEVRIQGNDRYIIAHTTDTLILGDLQTGKRSEACSSISYDITQLLSRLFKLRYLFH